MALQNFTQLLKMDKKLPNEETQLILSKKDTEDTKKTGYPISVAFIIGTEFCERFCFYGMKTILILYLSNILLFNDDKATVIYHIFVMGCFFTPLLGGILADSYLGKFRTILYISILYACGNIVLSLAAIPNLLPMSPLSMLGLSLIALGAGGIKPCVAAFGGDQFNPNQVKQLHIYFSMFYMAVNMGSLFSTFITPILREDVKCFHSDSCFPLAFGVPAILMIISLCLFVIGRPKYKIVAPTGNILVKMVKCICHALISKRKCSKESPKKSHWVDYADGKYERSFLTDVKSVLRVLFLYLPLPMFYAVYDQQGSRWTLQATRMDGRLPWFTVKPDQMHILNPFLIITLVPFFEYVVYPFFDKCHFLVRPLHRMITGGLLAASAFVLAGILQIYIERLTPEPPPPGHSKVALINGVSCQMAVNSSLINSTLAVDELYFMEDIKMAQSYKMALSSENCPDGIKPLIYEFNTSKPLATLLITSGRNGQLDILQIDGSETGKNGEASVIFLLNSPYNLILSQLMTIELEGPDKSYHWSYSNSTIGGSRSTGYHLIKPGRYHMSFRLNNHEPLLTGSFEANRDGNYIFVVSPEQDNSKLMWTKYTIAEPMYLSMMLQIPQYITIAVGEVLFSVTGLKFAYSQAPESMKAVVQAAWLFTNGFGDLIIVLVAEFRFFSKQSNEFFLFSGLLFADMAVFAFMANFYKYAESVSRSPKSEHPRAESPEIIDEKKSERKDSTTLS